jgi:pimeloyl-ACP methyl ester carboxylesterase
MRRLFLAFALLMLLSACGGTRRAATDRLQPCTSEEGPTGAYCGSLAVWEDRAAGKGRRIDLRMVVFPALRRDPKPDPLFVFAGGPGQGAAKMALTLGTLFRRFQKDRDIVLVDQRGTGGSHPLNCRAPEGDSDDLSKLGDDPTQLYRDCLQRYDADPKLYTTSIAMDDIEEVRRHLGYGPINLWGASYGTRAALVYLRQYPDAVRSAVLDGVAPPGMALPLYFPRDGQRALDLAFEACWREAACHAAFPDLRAKFEAVLKRLAANPKVKLTHPRTGMRSEVVLSRATAAAILMGALYSPATAALLPRVIADAAAGDYGGLLGLASAGEAMGEGISEGMHLSVVCAEDFPRIQAAEIGRVTANTFLGEEMIRNRMKACAFWPAKPPGEEFYRTVVSDKPVLLLSGELDPVTPPGWAAEGAGGLKNSRQIVVPGAGHGVSSLGCVSKLMGQFLEEGTAANLNAECVKTQRRPPFFLTYSGPAQAGGAGASR